MFSIGEKEENGIAFSIFTMVKKHVKGVSALGRINAYILDHQPKSYAREGEGPLCQVDCSLGVNADPVPQSVMEALAAIDQQLIKHYPHQTSIIPAIMDKFQTVADLQPENIVLGNGSFDLLCNINLLYLNHNKAVLSYAPQFSAYTDHIRCIGAAYMPYLLQPEQQYRFHLEEFLSLLAQDNLNLVCLENPNNPTGQILSLEIIEKIIIEAQRHDLAVVIDEAYGDYMPLENSAVCLVNRYDHVFVTKTFSKGYGLAGIRTGYAVGSVGAVGELHKLVTPFNCNSLARNLAEAALQDTTFCPRMMERTKEQKEKVMGCLKKIKVAHTSPTTPIMLLYVEQDMDLYKRLLDFGIVTVSGLGFDHLQRNAVRLMLCEDIDLLIRLLGKAEINL